MFLGDAITPGKLIKMVNHVIGTCKALTQYFYFDFFSAFVWFWHCIKVQERKVMLLFRCFIIIFFSLFCIDVSTIMHVIVWNLVSLVLKEHVTKVGEIWKRKSKLFSWNNEWYWIMQLWFILIEGAKSYVKAWPHESYGPVNTSWKSYFLNRFFWSFLVRCCNGD